MSVLLRSSGPNLAWRFRSKSTSSLPLAGSLAYSALTMARVLTVKSTTDWKVSTGARPFRLSSTACRSICACSRRATSEDWRAPFTGKLLYLKGLNSGTMPSHAALSKAGISAGQPNTPAKRAMLVMPIIGANSTMWSGRASDLSSSASSAYFMASAPPLEKPMTCSGVGRRRQAPRLAHRQVRGRHPLLPLDLAQARGHGAVAGQPDRHRHIAGLHVAPRHVAQAVGRIGQAVQQHHRADRRARRRQHVGAVPVLCEAAWVDRAAAEVAVGLEACLGLELVGDLAAHLLEELLLDVRGSRPSRAGRSARPWLQWARRCASAPAPARAASRRRARRAAAPGPSGSVPGPASAS